MIIMRLQRRKKGYRTGFTLVELAIVLGVSSLLMTGLWRLMSSGNTRTRDQVAAEQHRKILGAAQAYLETSEGQTKLAALAPSGGIGTLPIPSAAWTDVASCKAVANMAAHQGFCDYLPPSFMSTTTNPYNQTFLIRIRKEDTAAVGTAPKNYSFAVMTSGGQVIPDTSGSRIASLIGRDGGFRYSVGVCGAVTNLCGSYGTWTLAPLAAYGVNVTEGRIGSVTYRGGNVASDSFWLARKNVPGDQPVAGYMDDLNTIQTDVSLGGRILYGNNSTATGYASQIQNLRKLEVGGPAIQDGLLYTLKVIANCYKTGPTDASCAQGVDVQGDIAVTGLVTANKLYAGQFIYQTTPSDNRLKTEIKPLTGAAQNFAQTNGYSFKMKDTGETRYGVMAQEIEKFYPEIVHQDTEGMLSVDYMGLVGPLVAAVRELKEENDKLRADVQELQKLVRKPAKTTKN